VCRHVVCTRSSVNTPSKALGIALSFLLFCASSQAAVHVLSTTLSGGIEAPPNASAGTGTAFFTYNDVAHTLALNVVFSGLTGTVTAAHIHATTTVAFSGTAGVATQVPTFDGFPLGGTSGSYQQTFDLTAAASYNPAFLNNATNLGSTATAEATLTSAMFAGKAYLNIHTTSFPGGEIRGFTSRVPDKSTTAALLAPVLLAAFFFGRRQRIS
jgi:hypothetical protein